MLVCHFDMYHFIFWACLFLLILHDNDDTLLLETRHPAQIFPMIKCVVLLVDAR